MTIQSVHSAGVDFPAFCEENCELRSATNFDNSDVLKSLDNLRGICSVVGTQAYSIRIFLLSIKNYVYFCSVLKQWDREFFNVPNFPESPSPKLQTVLPSELTKTVCAIPQAIYPIL